MRYILSGSYIIHDGWGRYRRVLNNYRHHRYIHHQGDPDNTNRAEDLWGELRAFVRNIYSAEIVEDNI